MSLAGPSMSKLPKQCLPIVTEQEDAHPRAQAKPRIASEIGVPDEPSPAVSPSDGNVFQRIPEFRLNDQGAHLPRLGAEAYVAVL